MSGVMRELNSKLAALRSGAHERVLILSQQEAEVVARVGLKEGLSGCHFTYDYDCTAPVSIDDFLRLQGEYDRAVRGRANGAELLSLHNALHALPRERVWRDGFTNTVVTVGKNDILTNQFKGSAYTAAWYGGLISSTSYSAIAAADTMSSHSGWTESTAYSNSTRVAPTFGTASAGSLATSSASTFNINASDTIKGGFLVTNSTKGGTTGTLYSAGLFSGGDQPVVSGNTLSVSLTVSA